MQPGKRHRLPPHSGFLLTCCSEGDRDPRALDQSWEALR